LLKVAGWRSNWTAELSVLEDSGDIDERRMLKWSFGY